jgi:ATP-dependent Zn protease
MNTTNALKIKNQTKLDKTLKLNKTKEKNNIPNQQPNGIFFFLHVEQFVLFLFLVFYFLFFIFYFFVAWGGRGKSDGG